jgi:TolB protein
MSHRCLSPATSTSGKAFALTCKDNITAQKKGLPQAEVIKMPGTSAFGVVSEGVGAQQSERESSRGSRRSGVSAALLSLCAVLGTSQAQASRHNEPPPTFWAGVGCSRLAYVQISAEKDNKQTYELKVSRPDGSAETTVVSSSEPLMTPAWSPDGKRLAYTTFIEGRTVIYEQHLDNGTRSTISMREGLNSSPAYSPDGRYIALTLSRGHAVNIFIMDRQTNQMRQLTDSDFVDTEAAWSPDGRYIAFTSDRNGGPFIYRVSVSGGRPVLVSPHKGSSVHPVYTPDGHYLEFANWHDHAFHICRLDLKTMELRTQTPGRSDQAPSVSPDGKHLLWVGGTMEERTLHDIRMDMSPSPLWTGPSHVQEAAWSGCVFPQ